MMEAGASEVSDEMVLEAIKLAQETNLQIIELQDEIIETVAKPKAEYVSLGYPKELDSLVDKAVEGKLTDAMSPEGGKAEMGARLDDLKNSVVTEIGEEYEKKDISEAFETFVEKEFRRRLLSLANVLTVEASRRSARSSPRRNFAPRARYRTLPAWGDPGAGLYHARTGRRQAEDRQPYACRI